jgi:hypothetical protein
MKIKRSIVCLAIAVMLISSLSITAFAADVAFSFNLSSTSGSTTFEPYTDGYNTKVYLNDAATVKVTSNNAPGYGYAYRMFYKVLGLVYTNASVTSPTYWVSGNGTVHPAYASGKNEVGRKYYVAGRIDNDYTGPYASAGTFNSGYT